MQVVCYTTIMRLGRTELLFPDDPALAGECCTPGWIVALTLRFYRGVVDLDPCALGRPGVPEPVPATNYYGPAQNGLIRPWAGKVFVNPPVHGKLDLWIRKCFAEHARGAEILLLMPVRTATRAFQRLAGIPRVYWRRRLIYAGAPGYAPFGTGLWYMGPRVDEFVETFARYGYASELSASDWHAPRSRPPGLRPVVEDASGQITSGPASAMDAAPAGRGPRRSANWRRSC